MILNGPGYAGPWPFCKETLVGDKSSTSRKISDLNRFSETMQAGDIVVLRVGTATVCGVDLVVGPYEWHDEFGDVDGWDLQHVRRVRWVWKSDRNSPPMFETYDLKFGDTTQILNDGRVKEWLKTLPIEDAILERPLAELPSIKATKDTELTQIAEFLFDNGVASASISTLLSEIGELSRIAKWYKREDAQPSEHETVTYLVVPLLRALGWTPQRMAIEWHYVDIALFERLPRTNESLRAVVEAKKMNKSCLNAISQAEAYSREKPACHRLIVTDGLRYGVHVRSTDKEPFRLYAYLNLTRLRQDYPVYRCEGAQEALLAMAPEWRLEGG